MSRTNTKHEANPAASGAQVARRIRAQVKPLANSTGAATARCMHWTRAWAAPQVERTGRFLQDIVAPKVSALLSSIARRIDPAKPSRSR
jgi:hypothetical protein